MFTVRLKTSIITYTYQHPNKKYCIVMFCYCKILNSKKTAYFKSYLNMIQRLKQNSKLIKKKYKLNMGETTLALAALLKLEEVSDILPKDKKYSVELRALKILRFLKNQDLKRKTNAHDDRFISLQSLQDRRSTAVGIRNCLLHVRKRKNKKEPTLPAVDQQRFIAA